MFVCSCPFSPAIDIIPALSIGIRRRPSPHHMCAVNGNPSQQANGSSDEKVFIDNIYHVEILQRLFASESENFIRMKLVSSDAVFIHAICHWDESVLALLERPFGCFVIHKMQHVMLRFVRQFIYYIHMDPSLIPLSDECNGLFLPKRLFRVGYWSSLTRWEQN